MIKEIMERRSVRRYKDQPVEETKLVEVLESARLAPSGSNTQPWRFILVRDDEMRGKLAAASHNQQWMREAPVHVVVVADLEARLEDTSGLVVDEMSDLPELKQSIRDTAICIEHMLLEAAAQGLGTCWIAWFVQEDIRPLLAIPKDKYVVGIITLGYADESPMQRPRKPMEELLHHERWQG